LIEDRPSDASKNLRILLVGNYPSDQQQSMRRYAEWLRDALVARGHTVTLIHPEAFFSKFAVGPIRRAGGLVKYLGYLDKYLLFPGRLRKASRQFDLVHVCDHSNSMYLRPLSARPNVITCHDLLAVRSARGEFPEEHTGWPGRQLQAWILRGLKNAQVVASVSQKTSEDLERLLGPGSSARRSQVILNPLNWSFHPQPQMAANLPEALRTDTPYFMHIGGNQWYKNRPAVVRIFQELARMPRFQSHLLVLAGKMPSAALKREIEQSTVADRILILDSVSNEDLQALYSNAEALIFPSLQEGFGWPIAEAQACGCPVVTTNRPPMTEVAGDAAIRIDPSDSKGAALAIAAGLIHRERLCEAGFQNVTRFDPDLIADQYCALYEAVLEGN
jgi:glycosyltransferase involved in cell wall biosynthesis